MSVKKKTRPAKPDASFVNLAYGVQVEYLNSGIAFSSSLVALNTAWSGYHRLAFGEVMFVAADPVVDDDAGRLCGSPAVPV
jgi:hypothetical protein